MRALIRTVLEHGVDIATIGLTVVESSPAGFGLATDAMALTGRVHSGNNCRDLAACIFLPSSPPAGVRFVSKDLAAARLVCPALGVSEWRD